MASATCTTTTSRRSAPASAAAWAPEASRDRSRNLAERAILPVLPDENDFPYAIRVVSEVMESNGSSSMASTCGSTLALMDGGVPIKRPVSGIAMGLIQENGKTVVLSDIQGLEDFLGDMDFKVTGTERGITALPMDNKATGLTFDILRTALEQAKSGRAFILDKMLEVIPESRKDPVRPRPASSPSPCQSIRSARSSVPAARLFAASRMRPALPSISRKTARRLRRRHRRLRRAGRRAHPAHH